LPDSTLPELASAVFVEGEMTVTVVMVIGDDIPASSLSPH